MQRIEQRRIARKRNGAFHILLLRMRNKRTCPDVFEQGRTEAAAEAVPRKRHDGNPHVECIAGRTASGVRKGIERNVHAVVCRQIIQRRALRFHTIHRNPSCCNTGKCLLPCIGVGEDIGLKEQPAPRHAAQNFRPCLQHAIIQLCKIVKTAKDDGASCCGHMCRCGCRMQRLPAEMRMRQDEQLLREALLCRTRRKDRVGEKVIHSG